METTDMAHELDDIVDQRISTLIREMEALEWRAEDVAHAIGRVIHSRWLGRNAALREARAAVSESFVSDGNEG